MSRYRLHPTPAQQAVLREHCAHALTRENLAVEQHSHWRPGRTGAPGYLEQCRQLTAARAEYPWLAAGSQTVQQQALRDFARALAAFVDPAPGTGAVVGIDRGVAVSAALSTGELLRVPGLTGRERIRLRRLERTLARATRGSNRRGRVRHAIARLRARERDRRTDWAEKASTGIARRFDVIRVEDLQITNMTRSAKGTPENPGRNVRAKAGLNREILRSGWGLLVRRLEDEAPGRVEKVKPQYTSQRCSACGQVDRDSRESLRCLGDAVMA